jgi:hypothetical protein
MSAVLGGLSYKGAYGGVAGDIGGALSQLGADAKAEQERKQKLALEASLRTQDQEWKQRSFDQDTSRYAAQEADRKADNERLTASDAQRAREHTESLAALATERAERNQDRDATRDENSKFREALVGLAGRRADQADVRINQNANKAPLGPPDENGDRWFTNPITHRATRAMIGADGTVVPEHPEVLADAHAAGGHAMPAAAAAPTPAAQGAGVDPTGQGDKPVQPGSTQTPADTHATTTQAPAAHPLKAPTPQNERSIAATYDQLQGLFTDVTAQMQGVGYEPPSALTQFGINMTKGGGAIPGVPDGLEKIAGNTAVGKFAPKYQTLETSYNSLSTFLTQMITGAQMSQQEADRIRSLVATYTGDTPGTIQLRLKQAQGIIDAARAKVSPRAGGGTEAPAPAARAALPPSPEAIAHYKSLIAGGMSPEQAEAETDAKFPS